MTITLSRTPSDGLSVRGTLKLHTGSDPACSYGATTRSSYACSFQELPTLENQQYLIPCGTYRLAVTYSPRFKRLMPLVSAVPGRSGIRFHPGTRPEHSHGCILLRSTAEVDCLRELITTHAPVTLKIINE